MIDVERCSHCPVVGLCCAVRDRAPHYCEKTNPANPDHEKYVGLVLRKSGVPLPESVDHKVEMVPVESTTGKKMKAKGCGCGGNGKDKKRREAIRKRLSK